MHVTINYFPNFSFFIFLSVPDRKKKKCWHGWDGSAITSGGVVVVEVVAAAATVIVVVVLSKSSTMLCICKFGREDNGREQIFERRSSSTSLLVIAGKGSGQG